MNASFLETTSHFCSSTTGRAWADPLGWALVDSTWQFRARRSRARADGARHESARRPELRYAVCVVGLLGIARSLPAMTWLRVSSRVVSNGPAAAPGLNEVRPVTSRSAAPLEVAIADSQDRNTFGRAGTTWELSAPAADPATAVVGHWGEHRIWGLTLKPWLPTLVSAWFVGVAFFALRPLWSWRTVRRLRRVATSPLPDSLSRLFDNAAAKVGPLRPVRVLQSGLLNIPAVVGFFRPVVLVPISVVACFPPDQLKKPLVHELRPTSAGTIISVNLFQTAIETLFFYHPAVWWISSQVRRERENCCDDVVLSVCKERKEPYASNAANCSGRVACAFSLDGCCRVGRIVADPHSPDSWRHSRSEAGARDDQSASGHRVAHCSSATAGVTSPSARTPATAASARRCI